jgi:hypothetical protein
MKANQDGHDFAQAQAPLSVPLRFKGLTEIIDGAKEFF